mgnify:CR=1 FL=1
MRTCDAQGDAAHSAFRSCSSAASSSAHVVCMRIRFAMLKGMLCTCCAGCCCRLQEYGSVYESTTCDEYDDFDKAGGLMACHINMLV